MATGCGSYVAKYCLCLFNFLFFLGGAVMLGVGIWLAVDQASFIKVTTIAPGQTAENLRQPSVIEQGSYILIAAGAFIFIISFLGYCGAVKESRLLLTAYGMFLVIILALEIAAAVLAAVYKVEAETKAKDFMEYTIKNFYTTADKADAITLAWNEMMANMRCCGVEDGPKDFASAEKWVLNKKDPKAVVPEPCCMPLESNYSIPRDKECPKIPTPQNSYNGKGCYASVMAWLKVNTTIVIIVGSVVGSLQLLGIILAFCLCKAIDSELK